MEIKNKYTGMTNQALLSEYAFYHWIVLKNEAHYIGENEELIDLRKEVLRRMEGKCA